VGCPPRSPGAGVTLTRVHLSSYPHESGTPQSAELRSAAILDRELDTRPRVRSVSVLGFAWGTESHDNGQT